MNSALKESYNNTHKLNNLPEEGIVTISGRIVKIRDLGNIIFANLIDFNGEIQISLQKKTLENFKEIKKLIGNGDIIGLQGEMYRTKADKLTVNVKELDLLTKAQILPHNKRGLGFQDPEIARRLRYVDIIYNKKQRDILKTRHIVTKTIREYLNENDFIEVETPYLQTIASGASATPFKTQYNALKIPLYLRIAPELFLKRYIVAGLGRVYEIGKCFRNEGIDPTHLAEFTMLEWYESFCSHESSQNRVIELLQLIFKKINKGALKNENFDFSSIKKIEYLDYLVSCGLPRNIWEMSYESLQSLADKKGIDHKDCVNGAAIIDRLYKKCGIHKVKNPLVIYNYPNKPLARQIKDRPGFSHSFQVVIDGKECVNAYLEERDPDVLLKEFEKQKIIGDSGDEDFVRQDNDFVQALRYGMPPCAGVGIGIDRLVSILTNTPHLRDTITFPLTKLKKTTK